MATTFIAFPITTHDLNIELHRVGACPAVAGGIQAWVNGRQAVLTDGIGHRWAGTAQEALARLQALPQAAGVPRVWAAFA